jgi:hypothetical protein
MTIDKPDWQPGTTEGDQAYRKRLKAWCVMQQTESKPAGVMIRKAWEPDREKWAAWAVYFERIGAQQELARMAKPYGSDHDGVPWVQVPADWPNLFDPTVGAYPR